MKEAEINERITKIVYDIVSSKEGMERINSYAIQEMNDLIRELIIETKENMLEMYRRS
jgi:hypothetical protein